MTVAIIDRNLEPGQFMLGNLIFGEFTLISVEDLDVIAYELNAQDYQVQGSNEIRFGQDTFKAMPLQMKLHVRVNRINQRVAALTQDFRALNFDEDPSIIDLQREWRAPDTLGQWDVMKPLYFCGPDGVTRLFWGRPGKFQYKKQRIKNSQYYDCTAEFRRSDTLGYSMIEYFYEFDPNASSIIHGAGGTAPCWVRALIYGPANVPIINFGSVQIQLNYNIEVGDVVEISSYSWERRCINLAGFSLAPYLQFPDGFDLSQIQLDNSSDLEVSWTATDLTSDSKMVLAWHKAYQVLDG